MGQARMVLSVAVKWPGGTGLRDSIAVRTASWNRSTCSVVILVWTHGDLALPIRAPPMRDTTLEGLPDDLRVVEGTAKKCSPAESAATCTESPSTMTPAWRFDRGWGAVADTWVKPHSTWPLWLTSATDWRADVRMEDGGGVSAKAVVMLR